MDWERFGITDSVWERVAPLLSGKASDRGVTARDNRLFLEAVLWRVRTGSPWRDLPDGFGRWNSVFKRFRRWVRAGLFERIFERLSGEPDFEYALIDGTIVPPSAGIPPATRAEPWPAPPTRRRAAQKILWGDGPVRVSRLRSGHQDWEAPYGCKNCCAAAL